METDRAIAALAESQYGLVTRAQAVRRGLSEAAFDRRVTSGNWTRVHRGVYRLTGSPQTLEQSVKAACLAIPGALASHCAAAAILDLPEIQPRVEITVLQTRRIHLRAVEVHRTTRLEPVDRGFEKGIPVTSLTRTVIDLCGVLAEDQMAAVLDHVLAKRRVPLAYVCGRLEALGAKGRKGAGTLAELLADRQGRMRHADSEFQRRLEKVLESAGLPAVRIEYPVRLANGRMAYVDAAFPGARLAIEADSYLHHSTLPAWSRDRARNSELVALGWGVLPITYQELMDDPGAVADQIARALNARGG